MKQRFERLWQWFQARERREQIALGFGAGVVALTLLYLLLWEPAVKAHMRNAQALDAARQLAIQLETLAARPASAAATANRGMSLLTAVDQSAKSGVLTKPLTRLQPEGDHVVRVWVDGVSFETLMRWVSQLQINQGIVTQSAQIDRGAAAGTVNAQLSLIRP